MNLDIPTKGLDGLLTLQSMRGIGPKTATSLVKRFDRLADIAGADPEDLRDIATSTVLANLKSIPTWIQAWDTKNRILEEATKHTVKVLSCFDDGFPELLQGIPDQPSVIYVKGNLKPDRRYVACVGTREPSKWGAEVARRITSMLVERHWGIVSGLAIGIDSECHTVAVTEGGYTVAILANGLDSVYPKKNQKLADEIVEKGGALVSEQPIGARAIGPNLVQRDRLQSGMSLATFVMQTDIIGGTMHTVRFTIQQGRLLFVPVPTEKYLDEEKSRGIRALGELTGPEFADRVQADAKYKELLVTRFSKTTPAFAIKNKDDYDVVNVHLNDALVSKARPEAPAKQERLFAS